MSIEDSLLLLSAVNVNSQQLHVFAMNNKASPPPNTSNKCNYFFPYFHSLDRRLSGEQTVLYVLDDQVMIFGSKRNLFAITVSIPALGIQTASSPPFSVFLLSECLLRRVTR
jgi:hypothetical protein